eukprot:gene3494-4350_t
MSEKKDQEYLKELAAKGMQVDVSATSLKAELKAVGERMTADWIKTTINPVVAPVNKALFGGWEGNWMAYNTAHDVALPKSTGEKLGFLMYPTAETAAGRADPYSPDDFKYQITAKEVKA